MKTHSAPSRGKPWLAAWCALAVAADAAESPPNIVWIMFDGLGYTDTGACGETQIPTPRIDELAAEGARFSQVYSGAPSCAPARNTLMTGQHTGRTKLRSNFVQKNWVIGQEMGLRE